MIPDFLWRQGDTEPVFADTLTYTDGSAVNLTGASLSLIVRSLAQAAPLSLSGPVESIVPTQGQIQWRPDTTDTDTIPPGDYPAHWQVVFADGTPMSFPTSGFLWIRVEENLLGVVTIGIRPGVRDVASLVRARTKIRGGKELGTFNDLGPPDGTRPTAMEVEGFIDDAIDEVGGKVQPVDPTLPPGSGYNAPGSAYERRYRGAVKLYAAILIETSLFPDQVKSGQSAAGTYLTLYQSRVKALIAEGESGNPQGEGSGGSGGGDAPADPAYSFPANGGGMVGWNSRWAPSCL